MPPMSHPPTPSQPAGTASVTAGTQGSPGSLQTIGWNQFGLWSCLPESLRQLMDHRLNNAQIYLLQSLQRSQGTAAKRIRFSKQFTAQNPQEDFHCFFKKKSISTPTWKHTNNEIRTFTMKLFMQPL